MKKPLKIYLAGPDVFLPNALEAGNRKKVLCAQYGFEGMFPLDNKIDDPGEKRPHGFRISQANENLINECQLVIANITPFRGPSADAGTIFEIGYARAREIPVFAYSNTAVHFRERTRFFFRLKPDAVTDRNGMKLEDFEMTDNLMIDGGILASGGIIITREVPKKELYTNLEAFEECLKAVKKLKKH
ncbi:MAG: nucleoside 2-deoxyribosyltransferase [Bacteroidales bacterium]|nr:nucleoside 2-deoxyribosyltransferase [Bacteroidales bacterium]